MAEASFTDEQLREMLGSSLSNDLGMGTANTAGSGLLNSLLGGVSGFLGGTGGQLLGTGLGIDALNEMRGLGKEAQTEALRIGGQAQADTAFKPFSISTGFGGVAAGPQGGYTTTLSPEQQALQSQLAGITGGLTGGYGGAPDVSGIQSQALGGVQGLLQQAQGGIAGREQDVYDRIRATQLPEEQRQQIALNERLAAQGRTGLRTAQFGGSPEQFAMEKARAEAMNQASLASIGQAQAQREADLAAATGMFGLGSQASFLPSGLQEGQLGNIQSALGLQYMPEQQLLGSLTPAISLADLSSVAQRQGAGLFAEAGMSGLAERLGAEKTRTEGLAGLYNSLINAQGNVAGASASSAGSTAGNVANALLGFLSKER
tara:strand:- start:1372 stop:2496 length:1125 start_codon:yes stop_codon:yes gene_type:complete